MDEAHTPALPCCRDWSPGKTCKWIPTKPAHTAKAKLHRLPASEEISETFRVSGKIAGWVILLKTHPRVTAPPAPAQPTNPNPSKISRKTFRLAIGLAKPHPEGGEATPTPPRTFENQKTCPPNSPGGPRHYGGNQRQGWMRTMPGAGEDYSRRIQQPPRRPIQKPRPTGKVSPFPTRHTAEAPVLDGPLGSRLRGATHRPARNQWPLCPTSS